MERDHLAIIGVAGGIILTWMYKEENGRGLTGLIWLRIGWLL